LRLLSPYFSEKRLPSKRKRAASLGDGLMGKGIYGKKILKKRRGRKEGETSFFEEFLFFHFFHNIIRMREVKGFIWLKFFIPPLLKYIITYLYS